MALVDLARMAALLGSQLPGAFQGVLLRKTGSQSITEDLSTGIVWQTEVYDIGGWITVPSTLVVVPEGVSRVRMFAAGSWGSTLGTTHTLRYVINGTFSGLPVSVLPSSVVEQPLGSPVIEVSPADTLSVAVLHDSGEAVDILTTTTMFGVEAVR